MGTARRFLIAPVALAVVAVATAPVVASGSTRLVTQMKRGAASTTVSKHACAISRSGDVTTVRCDRGGSATLRYAFNLAAKPSGSIAVTVSTSGGSVKRWATAAGSAYVSVPGASRVQIRSVAISYYAG